MAFNNWPYGNFADLNLDYILRVCREAQHFIEDSDFQEEVTKAINDAIADGTLPEAMEDEIAVATAAWLAIHITNPSNPPIDTSLTVENAAADAAAVGRKGHVYKGTISADDDLNSEDYRHNGVWTIGSANVEHIQNVPDGAGAHPVMLEVVYSGTVGIQTYREISGGTWQRGLGSNNQFGNWKSLNDLTQDFSFRGTLADGDSIGELTERGFWAVPSQVVPNLADAPDGAGNVSFVLNYLTGTGARYQIFSTLWGKQWYRYLGTGATTGDWHVPLRVSDTTNCANAFLEQMNKKAKQYGMENTFQNVSNPSSNIKNYGTAQDLFKMTVHAWFEYPELRKYWAVPSCSIYALNREEPEIQLTNSRIDEDCDVLGDSKDTWPDGKTLGDFRALLFKTGTRSNVHSLVCVGKFSQWPDELFVFSCTGASTLEESYWVARSCAATIKGLTPSVREFGGSYCAKFITDGLENPYAITPDIEQTAAQSLIGSTNKLMILMTVADIVPSWSDKVQVRNTNTGSGQNINSEDILRVCDLAMDMLVTSSNRAATALGFYCGNLLRYLPFGGV